MSTMGELEGIPQNIAQLSKTRSNHWSTRIRPNLKNLSVVIKSIKIKDQLGAVVFCLSIMNVFSWKCTFEICKLCFNVSICMKRMNFWFQTSLSFWISPIFFLKKRNKFRDHKIKKWWKWKCFQVLNNGDFEMINDHC